MTSPSAQISISAVHPALAEARSFLFVPGNRSERFEKAIRAGADAVILDLEDAVPVADKDSARAAIRSQWDALAALGLPLVVRINSEGSSAFEADVQAAAALPGLAGVMLPKAESAATLQRLHERLPDVALVPLIESAAGLDAVKAIAAAPGVLRLAVGHIDFMADLGFSCGEDESELLPLRFAVVLATRLARLAPAIDGVTVQTGDEERLRSDTLRARRLGYGGKLCIHPKQPAGVHTAFAPGEQEVAWARRVVQADAQSGGAAVQLDGRMVDAPVVLQARRTLTRADRS
ncbi:HpcH/HpaI aldolase/citrate lyase family protein [Azohydromonas lata]|uniref:CoA ester lyase n=1 Tax=Azohydromonas lata TaxID=45677 RepID=A0ABU5IG05_9BURK|nr:CoA ester lyase [Azohydromonas lata]MDZ5457927.1 CoA ester lyase [Azohydromonas lata]